MELFAPDMGQRNSFFEALQNSADLDLRDNRGKSHKMGLVLLGIIIALLRGKDGKMSSIHRSMEKKQSALCASLDIENEAVISRSHLPVFMKSVNIEVLGSLVFRYFGVKLELTAKRWLAIDGKELRGSILDGHTRGEAIVQAVTHDKREVYSQNYYNGSKDSERPAVEGMLEDKVLAAQKITMDALHFTPNILTTISEQQGIYIVGLKGNQSELLTDMIQLAKSPSIDYQLHTEEKGHGRKENRSYKAIDMTKEYVDNRWDAAKLTTLIEVKRTRLETKKGKYSEQISYYLSNQKITTQAIRDEIFRAIRTHWSVETNNNIRDVSLKEDTLKSIEKAVALTTSVIRTLITNSLKIIEPTNIIAQFEEFAEDFNELIGFLRKARIL